MEYFVVRTLPHRPKYHIRYRGGVISDTEGEPIIGHVVDEISLRNSSIVDKVWYEFFSFKQRLPTAMSAKTTDDEVCKGLAILQVFTRDVLSRPVQNFRSKFQIYRSESFAPLRTFRYLTIVYRARKAPPQITIV